MILQKIQFESRFIFFPTPLRRKAPEETAAGTCMTGRSCLLDLDKEGVLVAVIQDVLDPLYVARGLALLPELLARSAPEPRQAGLNRSPQGFRIHVSNHQDFVVLPVLNHGRNKTFFIEFEFIRNFHHGEARCIIILEKSPEGGQEHKKTGS